MSADKAATSTVIVVQVQTANITADNVHIMNNINNRHVMLITSVKSVPVLHFHQFCNSPPFTKIDKYYVIAIILTLSA